MTPHEHQKFTRSALLKGGGALIVVIGVPAAAWRLTSDGSDAPTTWPAVLDPSALDSWLAIHGDGTVTAFTGKTDLGQGNQTSLSQIVAEELDVPFARVRMVMGDTATLRRPGADRGQPDDRPRRPSAPAGRSRRTAGAPRPGSEAPRRPGRQAHRRGWRRQRGRRRFAAGLLRRARRWSPARRADSGQAEGRRVRARARRGEAEGREQVQDRRPVGAARRHPAPR